MDIGDPEKTTAPEILPVEEPVPARRPARQPEKVPAGVPDE